MEKWRENEQNDKSVFGPLLGIFMPRIEKLYEKWDLVDGKSQIEKEIEGLE